MVGGAAGDHDDPLDIGEDRLVERPLIVEVYPVPARGSIGDRLGDSVGLFVDLLEHERLEAALLGGLLVPVDGLHRPLDGLAVAGGDGHAVGAQDDDLAVLDVLNAARLCEEGGHGGAHELLALAAPHDQRALLARAHEHVGLVEAHGHEGVVPLELRVGAAHRLGEVIDVVLGDEVGDDLGVGLRGEDAAAGEQALPERHVVLDDPVDDHVHAVAAVVVGVGVLLADPAVRGPARVPDPGRGGLRGDGHRCGAARCDRGGPRVELGLQRAQVAHSAHRFDVAVGNHGDAGRVVAAVLELG